MALLVIGYGNPLREDDGAGWYVAERIAALHGDAVRVIQVHQLTPELSAEVSAAELACFVDARADEPDRGVEITEIEPADAPTRSHYSSPRGILATARALFGSAPKAYLVSLPAYSFGYSERLTPRARAAADRAVELLSELIRAR